MEVMFETIGVANIGLSRIPAVAGNNSFWFLVTILILSISCDILSVTPVMDITKHAEDQNYYSSQINT